MKNTLKRTGILSLFCFLWYSSYAQNVFIENRGLEDQARMGLYHNFAYSRPVEGWSDCGRIFFPNETPPDIHPSKEGGFWKNTSPAYEGETYVGLVVRNNDTWESISQRLNGIIQSDKCYEWSIAISRSDDYWSKAKDINSNQTQDLKNFVEPTVMRMWGGNSYCDKKELIAQSTPIDHKEWKKYNFEIDTKSSYNHITIEGFYNTPIWEPYNGHILIDDLSDFIEIDCDTGEEKNPSPVLAEAPKKDNKPEKETIASTIEEDPIIARPNTSVIETSPPKPFRPRYITELNRKSLDVGQKIRIKMLSFEADTSSINEEAFPVLDELVEFLLRNKDIKIEVGGHTNGNPTHSYSDSLSTLRAKMVADYVVLGGVDLDRVEYKGYGKRKPIVSNATIVGRNRNQRVEIEITKMGR